MIEMTSDGFMLHTWMPNINLQTVNAKSIQISFIN